MSEQVIDGVEERFDVVLVYMGRRMFSDNKARHAYSVEGQEREMFFKKNLTGTPIGSRVSCKLEGDSVYGPYVYVDNLVSSEDLNKWKNLDRLAYDHENLEKAKKKKETTFYDKSVKVLREMYRDAPYSQRQLFINRLISDIIK